MSATAPRLAARLSAALQCVATGAALRAMAPFAPWWVDLAVYAAFAALGGWGVRVAEHHPEATLRAQVIRGARWVALALLLAAALGFAKAARARPEKLTLLCFAVPTMAAFVVAAAAGAVAIGCLAGRAVAAAGAAPPGDVLDHLAARAALGHGLTGAALWLLGRGPVTRLGLVEAALALAAAALVWARDGRRLAWVERVRAGEAPPWRWGSAREIAAPRWSCADEGPLTEAIVREAAAAGDGPFREAPAGPREAWGASLSLAEGLRARRRRAAWAALATACALGVGLSVYRAAEERAPPEAPARGATRA